VRTRDRLPQTAESHKPPYPARAPAHLWEGFGAPTRKRPGHATFSLRTTHSIITTTSEEGAECTKALGIWGALGGIGATTAWLIGGPIVDGLGWDWIFSINIPSASPRSRARRYSCQRAGAQ
jgi:hypothetical protein